MPAAIVSRACRCLGQVILMALFAPLVLAASDSKKGPDQKTPAERYPLENYLTRIAEQQWREREARMAAIKTPADVAARADYVRAEFLKAFGGLPEERTPLNARITGTLEREGYRIEKLVFESQPGYYVTANIYVPTTRKGPFPAILAAQGHAVEGKASQTYQRAYILMALNGHLVLAFDPPGQGERFETRDSNGNMQLLGHFSPGLQCVLTGGNIMRYFMWDGMRAIDYLHTRSDVDSKRIGVAGNSGGGTQSAFLSVLEPRIAASAPSSYWTSWPALWAKSGPQDSEQVLHQTIKRGIDYSDVLIAFAPKPIIMLTATKDSFPIAGARDVLEEGKRFFSLVDASDRLGYFEYNDPHGWSQPRREAACAWFNRWFYGRTDPVTEPADLKPETIEALNSTSTGQVVTALNGKTTQMMALEMATQLHASRTLARTTDVKVAREIVARRLELSASRAKPQGNRISQTRHDAYTLEVMDIVPEPGITLRTEIAVPLRKSAAPRPAIIIAVEFDEPPAPSWEDELGQWIDAGYIVAVARLRGLLPPDKPNASPYTMRYRTAMRALVVGKTMAGMRVEDLLAVYGFVAGRPDVQPKGISVVGRGTMGTTALYAAALEPNINKIVAERTPVSFMDIARATAIHPSLAEIILPGVFHDFDLPDIAKLAGAERVVLMNPVSLANPAEGVAVARREFDPVTKVIANAAKVGPRELE